MPRKSQHLINADWNEWMWDRLGTNKLCKHSAWPPLLFYVEHGQSTCKWPRNLVISMLCPLLGADRRSVPSTSSLQSLKWVKVAQSCPTPCNPWNSPGQNTGVGSLSLPQGIFPAQGSNPGLPHCRQILYQLFRPWTTSLKHSHKNSSWIIIFIILSALRYQQLPEAMMC